jgi:anti-sigma factor RsiW
MSNHLSEEQLAKCFVGQATHSTDDEQQHLAVCLECSAELERLRSSISHFRSVLTDRVESRLTLQPSLELRPASVGDPKWRWALVAATALVLAVMPFAGIRTDIVPRQAMDTAQRDADADALMRAVELQLSRTIPAPMEPVIALLPANEIRIPSGGPQ